MRLKNEKLNQLAVLLANRVRSASLREKVVMVFAVCVLTGLMIYSACDEIASLFTEQGQRLESAERDRRSLPTMLEKHAKLQHRKSAIEKAYRDVEIKEGALAQLDTLLKEKSSIDKNFDIRKASEPKTFGGGDFQQTLFTVKFNISDYPQLVDLLKKFVSGAKPFLIRDIDINKARGGQRLELVVDLSSISRVRE